MAKRYKIECCACGEQRVIPGDDCPRFCPMCGSEDIREVTTLAQQRRVEGERLLKKLEPLLADVERAHYEYVKLFGEYAYLIQILREYKRRKIVTPEEAEKYLKGYNDLKSIQIKMEEDRDADRT